MQINRYDTAAAYAADTERLNTKSAISQIDENNSMLYDGVNCIVYEKDEAGIGDLVIFDKSKDKIGYIKAGTVSASALAGNLIKCAVVYARKGDNLLIAALNNLPNAIAESPFSFKISNIDPSIIGTLTIMTGMGEISVSWEANSTLEYIASSIATKIADMFEGDDASVSVFEGINIEGLDRRFIFRVYGTGGGENVTTSYDEESSISIDLFRRNNNFIGDSAGLDLETSIAYYSVNGEAPTWDMDPNNMIICNQDFFENSSYAVALRAAYNSYSDYIKAAAVCKYPDVEEITGMSKTGNELITLLPNAFGTRVSRKLYYPAIYNANAYGIVISGYTTGLEACAWHLPSPLEMYLFINSGHIVRDTGDDIIDKTLEAVSGSYPHRNFSYGVLGRFGSGGIYYNKTSDALEFGKNEALPIRPVAII
jgi:hypothetical protein